MRKMVSFKTGWHQPLIFRKKMGCCNALNYEGFSYAGAFKIEYEGTFYHVISS